MTEKTFTEAPASVNLRFNYRGAVLQFTLRGESGAELLGKVDPMLDKLEKMGATFSSGGTSRPVAASNAPICAAHGQPMKASKKGGGWYCSKKVADVGGGSDGSKPIFCKATAK